MRRNNRSHYRLPRHLLALHRVRMFVDRSVFWIWSLLIGILGIVAAIPVLNHPLFAAVLLPATLVLYLGLLGAAVASFPACRCVWTLSGCSSGIAAVVHPTSLRDLQTGYR